MDKEDLALIHKKLDAVLIHLGVTPPSPPPPELTNEQKEAIYAPLELKPKEKAEG